MFAKKEYSPLRRANCGGFVFSKKNILWKRTSLVWSTISELTTYFTTTYTTKLQGPSMYCCCQCFAYIGRGKNCLFFCSPQQDHVFSYSWSCLRSFLISWHQLVIPWSLTRGSKRCVFLHKLGMGFFYKVRSFSHAPHSRLFYKCSDKKSS